MTLWYAIDGGEASPIELDIVHSSLEDMARDMAMEMAPGRHTIAFWEDEAQQCFVGTYAALSFVDAYVELMEE